MISASDSSRRTRGRVGQAVAGLLAVGLLAALAVPSAAKRPKPPPPPRFTFAGVPWLAPADSAIARLTARGYSEVPTAKDSDMVVCRGQMFEHEALATAYLDDQGRVVRWVVVIASRGEVYDWPDIRKVFYDITEETQARYGAPRTVVEKYRFPYERGDGREDEALRDGKATIRRVWTSVSGDKLGVEVDQTAAIILIYEAPEWFGIESRRRTKKAADL